jgi:hypothetical protein
MSLLPIEISHLCFQSLQYHCDHDLDAGTHQALAPSTFRRDPDMGY